MAQIGNKQNAILNGEWGKHRGGGRSRMSNQLYRRWTSKKRRALARFPIAWED